jgi:hypothetical protein
MSYFNRVGAFIIEHKRLIILVVFLASLTGSVVYSWGPPADY